MLKVILQFCLVNVQLPGIYLDMLLLSFFEKEKLGKPKEEIGNLKMDLNICILMISKYNICDLKISTLNICIFNTMYLYFFSVSM